MRINRMRRINKNIKNFLMDKINPSSNSNDLKIAKIAIKIIERGFITEYELRILGYKEKTF